MAVLSDKLGTAAFTNTLRKLAANFNDAGVMVERNNHGHAILLGLLQAGDTQVILGLDGKPGWASSERGKTLMYDLVADTVQAGDTVIYDETTREQLASIEANTLQALVVLAQWRLLVAVLVLGALGGAAVLVVGVAWGMRRGLVVLLVALGVVVLAWVWGRSFCGAAGSF